MDKGLIRSLLLEYKIPYVTARTLYSLKLKSLQMLPKTEALFERKAEVVRCNLFDLDNEAIREFLSGIPVYEKEKIIKTADRAINGIIPGFSNKELDYGNPPAWNYHPLTKKTCKNVKWYALPDFDKDRGDIKYIWEVSRFTHFYSLARAYLITADRKYYQAFSEQIDDWVKKNPYTYGANFKCGQECALRMLNTLIIYAVFKKEGLTTVQDENNVKQIVKTSYQKILSNFFYAYRCIKNNHTLSEITGMMAGAWCCGEKRQLEKACGYFEKTISCQFTADGGYIQNSANYQRFAMQIIECVLKINENIKYQYKNEFYQRITASLDLLYQMQNTDGSMPNYGANDGALIFPVTSCEYPDYRPVLNVLNQRMRGKSLYPNGKYSEESLWFYKKTVGMEERIRSSQAFKEAGIYILRKKDLTAILYLKNFKYRPAHMDQQHIDIWYKGVNLFCDSGSYSYSDELGKKMVLTEAHNTLHIPGKEQMSLKPPFLIYNWTKCSKIEYGALFFRGKMHSVHGYSHTRDVRIEENEISITDLFEGNTSYELLFHTPCVVKIRKADVCELYLEDKKIGSLLISNGQLEIKEVYRSLYYGKKEKINVICVMPSEKKCRTCICLEKEITA